MSTIDDELESGMISGSHKRCKGCGEIKLLDEFYREKMTKDGRMGKCRKCHNNRTKIARRIKRSETGAQSYRGEYKGRRVTLYPQVCHCGEAFYAPRTVTLIEGHDQCRAAIREEVGRKLSERYKPQTPVVTGERDAEGRVIRLQRCKTCGTEFSSTGNVTCGKEECVRSAVRLIGKEVKNHPLYPQAVAAYKTYVRHCLRVAGRDVVEPLERWCQEWIEIQALEEAYPTAPAEAPEDHHSFRCYYQYTENRVAA